MPRKTRTQTKQEAETTFPTCSDLATVSPMKLPRSVSAKAKAKAEKVIEKDRVDIVEPEAKSDAKSAFSEPPSSPVKSVKKAVEATTATTPTRVSRKKSSTVVTPVRHQEPSAGDENAVDSNETKVKPSTPSLKVSTLYIDPKVDLVYKLVRKSTGTLGGNGYDGAIYGELTMHSMQRVINFLVERCEMTPQSRFIDVGSGLGKPNFHATQDPAVRLSLGIELEEIRWKLAMHNLNHVLEAVTEQVPTGRSRKTVVSHHIIEDIAGAVEEEEEVEEGPVTLNGGINFIVGDIDDCKSTDPFTHIYQFDLGFPPPLQQSIAHKFNNSMYAKYLVSYRPPYRVIEEYGYAVEAIDQFPTSMHGSGESHTAYFYRRINTPATRPLDASWSELVKIPARIGFVGEVDEEVQCDKAFAPGVRLAVGPLTDLKKFVHETFRSHLDSGRPVRTRKSRIFA